MRARIRKMLVVGLTHGHLDIVLGAWGCEAFGNDPELIAKLFGDALRGPFAGWLPARDLRGYRLVLGATVHRAVHAGVWLSVGK